jgi:GNAT superfamily N-acetyltransferase
MIYLAWRVIQTWRRSSLFWENQPMLRLSNRSRYKPGELIDPQLPSDTQPWLNFKSTICHQADNSTWSADNPLPWMVDWTRFICTHYLQNEDNQYLPTLTDLLSHFQEQSAPSFVMLYYQPPPEQLGALMVGCISARPIRIWHCVWTHLLPNNMSHMYLVDLMCVHKGYRKQGIAQQLIQTQHYVQRHASPSMPVSIFKRRNSVLFIHNLWILHQTLEIPARRLSPISLCRSRTG